ncbi:MAG: hypothetical protein EXQ63_00840 [Ilumatobacteraceae bacterium]|nr:hypothetical protein [Ilumatobacteraceae bacterium]
MKKTFALTTFAVLGAVLASCGGSSSQSDPTIKKVPQDFKTIQAAVDVAVAGDLILIDKGIYAEAVTVETDNIVIRGLDRNEVILEGNYTLDNGIRIVGAKGVVVENMTARNYRANGFFWTGVDGYRGSYLTAVRNGDYGIYAFDSVNGLFEHSYGGGSPDAGFYIGQCKPCNAVINDVIAENNGLGYSGTNASGNLVIANSTFRLNRAGIVPNSLDSEKLSPQEDNIIVGNLVYSNNNALSPAIGAAKLAMGNGILVAGGNRNQILRNRVWDHDIGGIGIVPNYDKSIFWVEGNSVQENDVSDSRVADLALTALDAKANNCFAKNIFATSKPADIENAQPCTGTATAAFDKDPLPLAELINRVKPESGDLKKIPDPELQTNMPDAAKAKAVPMVGAPTPIDIASVMLPAKP